MTEPNEAFELRLLAIFAEEAHGHLAQIDASLAALERACGPAQAALAALLDALHTLKGAARSVELGDLEFLCHALENVFTAATRSGATLAPAQCQRIRQALELARLLTGKPTGRSRNQALLLIGQLDALARELAAALESEIQHHENEQHNA